MKREDAIRESLLILRHRMGLTVPQFAEAVGIPEGTLKNRLRNPGDFRMSEVWRIDRVGEQYGISMEGGAKSA